MIIVGFGASQAAVAFASVAITSIVDVAIVTHLVVEIAESSFMISVANGTVVEERSSMRDTLLMRVSIIETTAENIVKSGSSFKGETMRTVRTMTVTVTIRCNRRLSMHASILVIGLFAMTLEPCPSKITSCQRIAERSAMRMNLFMGSRACVSTIADVSLRGVAKVSAMRTMSFQGPRFAQSFAETRPLAVSRSFLAVNT
jgi:hypothetical protein